MLHKYGNLFVSSKMTQKQIDKIVAQFAIRLEATILFDIVVDAALIGGFLAKIDGMTYDASIREKLATFENITR